MAKTYFEWLCISTILWIEFSLKVQAPRPYINDEGCPRKPELSVHRKCLKKCRTDLDCKGRNRRCMCDDVCGKACVKPSLRCESLKPIFNGKYELEPSNVFSAKVTYKCNRGYMVNGVPQRVCQGDGYWSGTQPSCIEEGNMADTAIIPTLGKCQRPPVVHHAINDGPSGKEIYPLGAQINYKCEDGYNIDGYIRSMCIGDGRWVGPRMTCSPRRCGHPGDIQNGVRDGNAFVYPNRVKYMCNEGYEMLGRSFRVCMANGKWSGNVPICKPTKCSKLEKPDNGQMLGKDITYGATVRFSCNEGFDMKGSRIRRCEHSGEWSGDDVHCAQVDCGSPGPFYNGFLDGGTTTFGSEYKFRCYGRTTFEGPSMYTTCQENGLWSNPVPKCWLRCPFPSIRNGTVLKDLTKDDYATHRDGLNVTCASGHMLKTNEQAHCFNGSWSFIPECLPAPCEERPREIREGYVRFYTMRHGDKARYKCNTGFNLTGDEYVVCQYGLWVGSSTPKCQAVYCKYPGSIEHGQILLVGMIGKYEYFHYVRNTIHNQEIEYHCNKEYKRVGPAAATCVDGFWSPTELPKCVPKQHPKLLYLFRGKRSVDNIEDSNQAGSVISENLVNNSTGVIEHQEWDTEKGFCEVPEVSMTSSTSLPAGYYVPDRSVLEVTCSPSYHAVPIGAYAVCNDGMWTNDVSCVAGTGNQLEESLMSLASSPSKDLSSVEDLKHSSMDTDVNKITEDIDDNEAELKAIRHKLQLS